MVKNKKDSFLLYSEHIDLINELTNEQAGELFKKIFEYVSTGVVPELNGMPKMAFISIRQDLDKNAEKYEEKCRKMSENGKKGGRPSLSKPIGFENNQMVFSKSKKSLYDNDNDNDNVLSLNEENDIQSEDRDILENYIKENKLATKNVKAYARKLISNGDWKVIVKDERERFKNKKNKISPENRIKLELESITDKYSCAKVLAKYYIKGDPPEEFNDVMEKYDLDTYDKIEAYTRELSAKIS